MVSIIKLRTLSLGLYLVEYDCSTNYHLIGAKTPSESHVRVRGSSDAQMMAR